MNLMMIFFILLSLTILSGYIVFFVYLLSPMKKKPRWIATSQTADFKGQFIYSDDGKTWKEIPEIDNVEFADPTNFGSTNVAFGNGTWVSVGNQYDGGQGRPFYYSKNGGIDWVAVTLQDIEDYNTGIGTISEAITFDISFANGRFIACGNFSVSSSGQDDYHVSYSDDGIHWKLVRVPFNTGETSRVDGVAIGFGDSTWMTLTRDDNYEYNIFKSTDNGKSWTDTTGTRVGGITATLGDIAYGNGKWFVVAGNMIVSSDNGDNWVGVDNLPVGNATNLCGIAYGDGTWVAVGDDAMDNHIIYSIDNGETWSGVASGGFSSDGTRVAYSSYQKRWVAVGIDTDANDQVQWSDDGINWNTSEGATLFNDSYGIFGIGFGLM